MRTRNVVVLGATGSIGESARKVARDLPDRMRIVGLSAHTNASGLAAAAAEFPGARAVLSSGPGGEEALVDLARHPDADMVLVAIVGIGGLRPALAAIEAGKDIAVASKEILVMAGEIVMSAARRRGVQVLPVDSEHNAIFQCLDGARRGDLRKIILTCSGGPFRTTPAAELHAVTPEMALRHPTWTMGRKISIDSATLFNKGLEMIEAHWLFGVGMDRIDVVIHPQSIVHSMVEFVDGSVLAQMSPSDMCFPIQYAVTWPERVASSLGSMDFAALGALTFEAPRRGDFPALDLACEAGVRGGTLPAVLNAANEVAVAAFLAGRIRFPAIWEIVRRTMEACAAEPAPDLEMLVVADARARVVAGSLIG